MAPSSLGKQTANCESPHNCLMSLAMDLVALCDMWRCTNGSHLAVYSEDVVFACHFVATCLFLLSHPIGVLLVLAMLVKNYLKW